MPNLSENQARCIVRGFAKFLIFLIFVAILAGIAGSFFAGCSERAPIHAVTDPHSPERIADNVMMLLRTHDYERVMAMSSNHREPVRVDAWVFAERSAWDPGDSHKLPHTIIGTLERWAKENQAVIYVRHLTVSAESDGRGGAVMDLTVFGQITRLQLSSRKPEVKPAT